MNPLMVQRLSRKKHFFRDELGNNEKIIFSNHFGHFPYCLKAVKKHNELVEKQTDKARIILIGEGDNGEIVFDKFSIIINTNIQTCFKRNLMDLLNVFKNYDQNYFNSCCNEFSNVTEEDIKDFIDNQIEIFNNIRDLNKYETSFLLEVTNNLNNIINLGKEILLSLEQFDEDNKDKE